MKLIICGIKNSKTLLLKCPIIPTTAKFIPAKYVNVSPTKARAGYLQMTQKNNLFNKSKTVTNIFNLS